MQHQTTSKPLHDYQPTSPAITPVVETPASETNVAGNKQRVRRRLFISGPAVFAVLATILYFSSGRYVETDNAYLKANKVTISPEVSGPIVAVAVSENQQVAPGAELFRIDEQPYRIARERGDAQLRTVQAEIESTKASYRQKQEELRLAEINVNFAAHELARQTQLATQKLTPQAKLEEAQHNLETARNQMTVISEELAQTLAQLSDNADIPVKKHPRYLEAEANRNTAELNLQHTIVHAPFAGVASKVPQPGQYVATGSAVMSVIATTQMWIEANFTETDLTNVRAGQPVHIRLDTYPQREWSGSVQSISQATGAEFSVLPPQNASGNWVKIVQRIPVRIALDLKADDPPLRAGMTASVKIDTSAHHTLKALFSFN